MNLYIGMQFTSNAVPTGGYLVFTIPTDTVYKSKYTLTSYAVSTLTTDSFTLYSGTSQLDVLTIFGCPNSTSCTLSGTTSLNVSWA